MKKEQVVPFAAQIWPSLMFDFESGATVKECLQKPGVYVLFRNDQPYYIGKTTFQTD
jgi:hypothetical protein